MLTEKLIEEKMMYQRVDPNTGDLIPVVFRNFDIDIFGKRGALVDGQIVIDGVKITEAIGSASKEVLAALAKRIGEAEGEQPGRRILVGAELGARLIFEKMITKGHVDSKDTTWNRRIINIPRVVFKAEKWRVPVIVSISLEENGDIKIF